jgi:copper chaperone CopZ
MQTADLKVTGMTCGGCVGKVTHALKGVAGVKDASVSLSAGEAKVQFDEALTSPSQLKLAVQQAGYGVGAGKPEHDSKPKGGCCG